MKHRQKQETHKGCGALDPYGTTWAGRGFWERALPLVGNVYSKNAAFLHDSGIARV
ncbi:MAG: hypothetical protein ACOX5G_04930 [Kiritimatiellia bacterium]|jgi:hypothetical protein